MLHRSSRDQPGEAQPGESADPTYFWIGSGYEDLVDHDSRWGGCRLLVF